ncbi:unnamed protein product [Effrenium voratum]|uniref:Uncharacterized protein n=1 Tax=Effrenium voratum TaxID=2562239 RepID=A0AA36I808_9DINO|nr:unnamed protein product [Effrenium voratum]
MAELSRDELGVGKPAAELLLQGWKERRQVEALQKMMLKWFPTGIRIRLNKEFQQPSNQPVFQVVINGQTLVSKKWTNFTSECESGLWPTDRAKIRAQVSRIFEEAVVSAHEFTSEGDFSLAEPKTDNDPIVWVAPTMAFACR